MFRVQRRSGLWIAVLVGSLAYAVISGHWQSVGYLLLRVV